MNNEHFPGLEEHLAAAGSRAEAAYAERLIQTVMKEWYDPKPAHDIVREAGDELGWTWFNDTQGCPVSIYSRKLKNVNPVVLLKSTGFTKSPIWKAYFEVKANHVRDDKVALIFPVPGISNWVIHNDFQLALTPGFHTIRRQAASIDRGLVIVPLPAFLHALKEAWSPWDAKDV